MLDEARLVGEAQAKRLREKRTALLNGLALLFARGIAEAIRPGITNLHNKPFQAIKGSPPDKENVRLDEIKAELGKLNREVWRMKRERARIKDDLKI